MIRYDVKQLTNNKPQEQTLAACCYQFECAMYVLLLCLRHYPIADVFYYPASIFSPQPRAEIIPSVIMQDIRHQVAAMRHRNGGAAQSHLDGTSCVKQYYEVIPL